MPKLSKQSMDGNVETIILAELSAGANYGYALVKAINDRHAGLLSFGEGTIYPVLHRMEDKGLLIAETKVMPSGRARKYYRVAARGKRALAENLLQWKTLACVMQNVLDEVSVRNPRTSQS